MVKARQAAPDLLAERAEGDSDVSRLRDDFGMYLARPSIDGFSVSRAGKTVWRSNAGFTSDVIVIKKLHTGRRRSL